MKQRLTTMIIALAAIVGSATGQTISVEPIEMEVGAQATLSVGVSGLSDVTALQFNLQLPDGFVLDESAVEKSSAASGHELAIRPLSNGSRLFVLYNMDKVIIGNGELLRLPITAGSEAGSFSGNLTTFRTATTDAVSHAGASASFQITVTDKDDPAQEDYFINYDKETTTITRTDRCLNGVTMNGTTYTLPSDKLLYHEDMTQTFFAKPGDQMATTFNFTGSWMHGYVYIDKEQDGNFDVGDVSNGVIGSNSDVMTFSFWSGDNTNGQSGYNSDGANLTGPDRNVLNPPVFTMPQLADGFYRVRFKVDWNEIDPAGNTTSSNAITDNGGGFADARLRVFSGTKVNVQVESSENGSLTGSGGVALSGSKDFHTALSVEAAPAKGYRIEALHVTHGNLTADPQEIHGVPQYLTTSYEAADFSNNKLTIPAEIIDGDVVLRAEFVKDNTTGVDGIDNSQPTIDNRYSVDGVKLQGEPMRKGVYIVNGRKVVK